MEITTDARILVTGAGGGIADSIVTVFAEAGARLALADLSLDMVDDRARAHDAVALEADLTDPDAAARMVADARARLQGLDGLIHTAGGFATAPAEATDPELYDRLFDLNVRTLVITTAAVLPVLLEQRRGFLAGFSAAPGWHRGGGAGVSVYAAAQAAVAAFLHAVGEEAGGRGMTTAVVYPMGVVETEGNLDSMPDADRSGWIDPVEIARALLTALVSGPRGRLTELPVFPAPR